MPGSGLFALLDDITTLLDDVATLTKVATKKTAGVLGDDLALNAQQVAGMAAHRELPVVWAVAKGSVVNKAILVPTALLTSALLPAAITPLLMIGGAYLCYEGVEKVIHAFFHHHSDESHDEGLRQAAKTSELDLVQFEKEKIKGAVRTDFILSAEIIVIALGTVAGRPFLNQVGVLLAIAAIMTVGVYGLVGGIVKLDDAGLALTRTEGTSPWGRTLRGVGRALLLIAPRLMRFLSIAGTVAMFLVGGHILVEGIEALHHLEESLAAGPFGFLLTKALDLGTGVAVGAVALLLIEGVKRLVRGKR